MRTKTPQMSFRWYGLTDFKEALRLQEAAWTRVRDDQNAPVEVLGFEHPAVITLGRHSELEKEVISTENTRISEVVKIDRGGQATLHAPGQLVIYPIARVQEYGGVRDFICHLLKVTEQCLKEGGGVIAQQIEGEPGLYTNIGKIAFIGLRIDRGVSRHGLSINVNNDLGLFTAIRSCGVTSAKLDRLKDHGCELSPEEVFRVWQKCATEFQQAQC